MNWLWRTIFAGIMLVLFFLSSCDKINMGEMKVSQQETSIELTDSEVSAQKEIYLQDDSAGIIQGMIQDFQTGIPIGQASVSVNANGKTFSDKTQNDGTFSLKVQDIAPMDGVTLHVAKEGYATSSRAIVFEQQNLMYEVGTIPIMPAESVSTASSATTATTSGTGTTAAQAPNTRTITGRILNNFSSDGLAGVQIVVEDSAQEHKVALSDAKGDFSLSGEKFNIGNSYNLKLSKSGYVSRSDVSVTIREANNQMDNTPIHLYRAVGTITGKVENDTTGKPLVDAVVTAKDSQGTEIVIHTDEMGAFVLESQHFQLEQLYTVTITKTNYHPFETTVFISFPSSNPVPGEIVQLKIDASISTRVINQETGQPVSGVQVQTVDSYGRKIQAETDTSGNLVLGSSGFLRDQKYKLELRKENYIFKTVESQPLQAGINTISDIPLLEPPIGTVSITGKVLDFWKHDNQINNPAIADALIQIQDDEGLARTAFTNDTGEFTVNGKFSRYQDYVLKISKDGYSGQMHKGWQEASVKITGEQVSAGAQLLYPLGLFVKLKRSSDSLPIFRNFLFDLKQTHEKFLTGKPGFTLSGRSTTNKNSADTFYVHIDEPDFPEILPLGSKHSNYLAVNGNPRKGILAESLGTDSRVAKWNLKTYVMYHFFASTVGNYTFVLEGTPDTRLELYDRDNQKLYQVNGHSGVYNIRTPGWNVLVVQPANNNSYGFFDIRVTGPSLENNLGPLPQTWLVSDISKGSVLSWYSDVDKKMYVAAFDEPGSSGEVTISHLGAIGEIVRGSSFTGVMRAVENSGLTVEIQKGYFNILRGE
ncbi:MAG: carboxypeptidase regulatory-like domain-containing protein [SAR324 cluster bacterium]|nr:carboxypeptidase regulatory-like domain-containing protein [SAR324 cluster bacterium]